MKSPIFLFQTQYMYLYLQKLQKQIIHTSPFKISRYMILLWLSNLISFCHLLLLMQFVAGFYFGRPHNLLNEAWGTKRLIVNTNCVANLFINWWSFARIDRKQHTRLSITSYLVGGHVLFSGQSHSSIMLLFWRPANAKTSAHLTSLDE